MQTFKQLLIEISLQDHYEKYMKDKISWDEYEMLSLLDPTGRNDQRGKYLEWLINTYLKNKDEFKIISPKSFIKDQLKKFAELSVGTPITQFKTFQELFDHNMYLKPKESKKELKRKEKDIFTMPDDIKVIDVTDEWICIETLTREGNIKGAQYKTNPQANWCTAYLDNDQYWRQYHTQGDLLQFINKQDPYEKYQIFVKHREIKESRDYHDTSTNKPYEIIKELPNFEKNYGTISEQAPLEYVVDEEEAVYLLLSRNYEYSDSNFNRPPTEEEYENGDYYNSIKFQINHWDRFLNNCFKYYAENAAYLEQYKRDYPNHPHYSELEEKMDRLPDFFSDPPDATDKEAARDAVNDFYDELKEEWTDFLKEYEEETPFKVDYTGKGAFEYEKKKYIKDAFEEFKDYDTQKKLDFIEYFQDEFPVVFPWDDESFVEQDDDQLELSFESLRKYFSDTKKKEFIF